MCIKIKLIISLIVCSVSFQYTIFTEIFIRPPIIKLFLQRYLSGDIDQATHNKKFIFGPMP